MIAEGNRFCGGTCGGTLRNLFYNDKSMLNEFAEGAEGNQVSTSLKVKKIKNFVFPDMFIFFSLTWGSFLNTLRTLRIILLFLHYSISIYLI